MNFQTKVAQFVKQKFQCYKTYLSPSTSDVWKSTFTFMGSGKQIIFLQNGGYPRRGQHQWKFELIQGMYS